MEVRGRGLDSILYGFLIPSTKRSETLASTLTFFFLLQLLIVKGVTLLKSNLGQKNSREQNSSFLFWAGLATII